jgi:transglutaminase-like putative cysteine protease
MHHRSLLLAAAALAGCASTDETTDETRPHRTFEFTYRAALAEVPEGAEEVRLWVPIPESSRDQKIEDLEIEASHDYVVNDIENGEGRSLCVTAPAEPVDVTVKFVATRYETTGGGKARAEELEQSLAPNAMIPLDGKVAAIAASMPAGEDPLEVGRALYQHTLERMKYDKPEGGGWGRGDSEWACDARYGNCTDFHSYFIGLARAKDIPARFEMGFSIPATPEEVAPIGGYHCWAYFWDEDHGWVPVDISEADKDPSKADYFFGTLDQNRVTMTGGRDVVLNPAPAAGPLNFFVYPYAEVDGERFDGVTKEFSRRNL